MPRQYEFTQGSPLTTPLPPSLAPLFESSAFQTKRLLASTSSEMLHAYLSLASQMIDTTHAQMDSEFIDLVLRDVDDMEDGPRLEDRDDEDTRHGEPNDDEAREDEFDSLEDAERYRPLGEDDYYGRTDAELLWEARRRNPDQAPVRFDGGEPPPWGVLFATLALGLIEHAKRTQPPRQSADASPGKIAADLVPLALEAQAAIAYAQSCSHELEHRQWLEQQARAAHRSTLSQSGKRGARIRHQKTHELLKALRTLHQTGAYPTYSATVTAFLEQTPETDIRHLAPSNRYRTLVEALSRLVRGKRQLPPE